MKEIDIDTFSDYIDQKIEQSGLSVWEKTLLRGKVLQDILGVI